MMKNPHLDDNRIIWKNEYSGQYGPVDYSTQFDKQWQLFLEKQIGFYNHSGVETSDEFINHRITELTGIENFISPDISLKYERDSNIISSQHLSTRIPPSFFEGQNCIDIGCGSGRWTKALQLLGADVLSIDMSPAAIECVSRFNSRSEHLDIFEVLKSRHDLKNQFDIAFCWGIFQHTHDPQLAFSNAVATLKPGGSIYMMIYNDTYHHSEFVLESRRHYNKLNTFEEKLSYAYKISDDPHNAINQLDMLNTFYNWTFEKDTLSQWFDNHLFDNVQYLNSEGCAYHILASKSPQAKNFKEG